MTDRRAQRKSGAKPVPAPATSAPGAPANVAAASSDARALAPATVPLARGEFTFDDAGTWRRKAPTGRDPATRVKLMRSVPELSAIERSACDGKTTAIEFALRRSDVEIGRFRVDTGELSDARLVAAKIVSTDPGVCVEPQQARYLAMCLQQRFDEATRSAGLTPLLWRAETTGFVAIEGRLHFVDACGSLTTGVEIRADVPVRSMVASVERSEMTRDETIDAVFGWWRAISEALPGTHVRSLAVLGVFGGWLARRAGNNGRAPILVMLGKTGSGKTAFANFLARVIGGPNARCVSISSTANAIELAASVVGDQLLAIDDIKLVHLDAKDFVSLLQRNADGIAKQRLSKDASAGPSHVPRSTLLIVGEDFLDGEPAVAGRTLVWQVEPGDIDPARLHDAEELVASTRALVGMFLRSVLARETIGFDLLRSKAKTAQVRWADHELSASHGRLSETLAQVDACFSVFVEFVREHDCALAEKIEVVLREGLLQTAAFTAERSQASDLVETFRSYVQQAIRAGRAHIGNEAGREFGQSLGQVRRDGDLALMPDVTAEFLRREFPTGPFRGVTTTVIGKRLASAGILVQHDKRQSTSHTTAGGQKARFWIVRAEWLLGSDGLRGRP